MSSLWKRTGWPVALAVALSMALASNYATAGERAGKSRANAAPASPPINLFDAVDAGQVDLKFIAKNDREGRVILKNNTKKLLTIKLPDAFASLPVLGQGQGGGGGFGGGGGGFGGGGGGGGGGGFFNLPPEKVIKRKVRLVCLEHGKPDPRPAMAYELKPIESLTADPKVAELLRELGRGRCSQRAAQAAAWHLASGMSWDKLKAKRIVRLNATSLPYFTSDQLRQGQELASNAIHRAKNRAKTSSQTAVADGTSKSLAD